MHHKIKKKQHTGMTIHVITGDQSYPVPPSLTTLTNTLIHQIPTVHFFSNIIPAVHDFRPIRTTLCLVGPTKTSKSQLAILHLYTVLFQKPATDWLRPVKNCSQAITSINWPIGSFVRSLRTYRLGYLFLHYKYDDTNWLCERSVTKAFSRLN